MKKTFLQTKIILFFFLISFIKNDLVIIGPSDLISRYNNKPIEIVFGKMSDISNFYVHGEIFFENTTVLHSACTELGTLAPNSNQNEYSENFKILLAYNGDCSIEQKARNAQIAGASMLLLINNNEQDIKNVLLEDDGSGNDIKIPVGLISLTDGRIMESYLINNPKSRVMVEINFQQNIQKKKIEFKFFFSSSELKAYELINNITKYSDKFSDQVEFIPIYITHRSPSYNPESPQRNINCVTNGKYCYFPKETTIIQDGQRILMESLRQKCMYIKSIEKMRYYYEYLQSFYQNCLILNTPKFNERCSKQTLDILGYPIDYLDSCMSDSFGVSTLLSSTYIDNENTIFQKDYQEILKYKLTSFPAVVIDDKPLEGIIRENKIMVAICNAVRVKPDFCSFLTGETDEHIASVNRKKGWIYFLIVVIIIINIFLFFTFRRYIMNIINEKINFNNIDTDGRISNFVNNYMSINNNNQLDYQNFDTDVSSKNNKGYNRVEGSVNTV